MLSYGSIAEIFKEVIRVELELNEMEDSKDDGSNPTVMLDLPCDLFSDTALLGTVNEGDILIFTHTNGQDAYPLIKDDKEKERRIAIISSLES